MKSLFNYRNGKYFLLAFVVALYWLILLGLETFAYHVLNVKNMAAAMYPGLPVCDCIHAARWMQIAYFMLGPIYFIIYNVAKYAFIR